MWGCWFLKNSKPLKDPCLVLTNACLEPPLPRAGHPSPASFSMGSLAGVSCLGFRGESWDGDSPGPSSSLCVRGGMMDCVWNGQGRGFLRRVKEVLELS